MFFFCRSWYRRSISPRNSVLLFFLFSAAADSGDDDGGDYIVIILYYISKGAEVARSEEFERKKGKDRMPREGGRDPERIRKQKKTTGAAASSFR